MKRLESSSPLNPNPASAGGSHSLALLAAGGRAGKAFNSTWTLAAAGLFFAATAANLLCLSPRWYASKFIALVYEPTRFVFLTAATGAVAVQIFWAALENKPTAGPIWIARNLSTAWVFLPCYVLLYERNSPWMLAITALGTLGLALGLRRLLPAPATPLEPTPRPHSDVLPSLDGLPPRDSPLLLATGIALLAQAAGVCAANDALALAGLPLAIGVFLFAWRWSAADSRTAQWWTGRHPPLPQAVAAIVITSLTLIPFQVVGHHFGLYAEHHPPPKGADREPDSGYYGIILYPPPAKKEFVAPAPRDPTLLAGANAKPILIPFDGPYWYFKPPFHAPGARAHIAHGKTTDPNINPRSTDYEPLLMEAHQNLGLPIALACCREIDVAVTNADTRPGAITLALVLTDAASPGKPSRLIGAQPILSSQIDPIPLNRAPVKEVLRFALPRSTGLRRFDEIILDFQLAPRHARAGAKVSIDTFELIPK
jgi:hypothetical protein